MYRLELCNITDFPSAITSLYAFYYDVVQGGQYVWAIERMHKKYGMSV